MSSDQEAAVDQLSEALGVTRDELLAMPWDDLIAARKGLQRNVDEANAALVADDAARDVFDNEEGNR